MPLEIIYCCRQYLKLVLLGVGYNVNLNDIFAIFQSCRQYSFEFKRFIGIAEALGDPYICRLSLSRIHLSRELKSDDGQTVSFQPIAEWTSRA